MTARRAGDTVTIDVQLPEGWKIAADTLALEGGAMAPLPLPDQAEASPGMPQAVYRGPLTISATLTSNTPTLTFQTCNDTSCDLPRRAAFRFG